MAPQNRKNQPRRRKQPSGKLVMVTYDDGTPELVIVWDDDQDAQSAETDLDEESFGILEIQRDRKGNVVSIKKLKPDPAEPKPECLP